MTSMAHAMICCRRAVSVKVRSSPVLDRMIEL
ncbi:Uncharacterised protein [Mycobacteroides abscessus subsp. abscessus]|nr:Uncharacterised protein [Mycobacteroides abscessus subsp. abscessus]